MDLYFTSFMHEFLKYVKKISSMVVNKCVAYLIKLLINKFFFIPISFGIFCYCIFIFFKYSKYSKLVRCNETLRKLIQVCEYLNISCLSSIKKALHVFFPEFRSYHIYLWMNSQEILFIQTLLPKRPLTAYDWEACRFGVCDW